MKYENRSKLSWARKDTNNRLESGKGTCLSSMHMFVCISVDNAPK